MALIKCRQTSNVYISSRKSMTLRFFIHSKSKRAEAIALIDSGATENFMNLGYAKHLQLPIKRLEEPRSLFNVDGTTNKSGSLQFYTDLQVQTGSQRTNLRFFLTDLGDNKAILGYPWFAAVQPRIDWKRGWVDHSQLPIIFRAPNATKARFIPRQVNRPNTHQTDRYFIGRIVIDPVKQSTPSKLDKIPEQYCQYSRVFSEEASHEFPPSRLWDHAIELKPGAPASLPGKLIPLSQPELAKLRKFVKEHLGRGTIRPSKSPYTTSFFFIKKKDGKLQPVQDYQPINNWTIKNKYPLPLIPQLVDRLGGCSLYTKFDICWGYNNVCIKEGDKWKAAFLTNEGLLEPTVMFFSLTNSPATFQAMMNAIFKEEIEEGWLTVYMDDMLIATPNDPALHQECVHCILDKLEKHDLYLKPEKCAFAQRRIEFLGVVLENNTIQMDPTKVKGVADWPPPRNPTDVRSFLGFTGFYRYFIPNYSRVARPLLDLTKK